MQALLVIGTRALDPHVKAPPRLRGIVRVLRPVHAGERPRALAHARHAAAVGEPPASQRLVGALLRRRRLGLDLVDLVAGVLRGARVLGGVIVQKGVVVGRPLARKRDRDAHVRPRGAAVGAHRQRRVRRHQVRQRLLEHAQPRRGLARERRAGVEHRHRGVHDRRADHVKDRDRAQHEADRQRERADEPKAEHDGVHDLRGGRVPGEHVGGGERAGVSDRLHVGGAARDPAHVRDREDEAQRHEQGDRGGDRRGSPVLPDEHADAELDARARAPC